MAVEIEPLSPTDRCNWDEFTRFMLENTFPFHVNPSSPREEIESRKADGGFAPPADTRKETGVNRLNQAKNKGRLKTEKRFSDDLFPPLHQVSSKEAWAKRQNRLE